MSEIEKETASENSAAAPAKKGGKKIILIALVVIVIGAIAFAAYRKRVQAPVTDSETTYQLPQNDSPDDIDKELNSIDTGANLDSDFQSTDADIKTL